LAMVAAKPMVAPASPDFTVILRNVLASEHFCARFCNIKRRVWLQTGPIFHSSTILHHLVLVFRLDKRERGRDEDCKDSVLGLRSKDSNVIIG